MFIFIFVIFGLNIFTPHVENTDPDARYLPYPSTYERAIPDRPTLFVLGDAKFSSTRKGLQSSKHAKIASRLIHRLKKRRPGSAIVEIDEYNTSKHCPRCLGDLEYLRRKARSQGELKYKKKGEDGLVEDLRVRFCKKYVIYYLFSPDIVKILVCRLGD